MRHLAHRLESYFTHNHCFELRVPGLLITVGLMTLATAASYGLRVLELSDANIIMVYILGVLLVSRQTGGYLYGILASVLGVMSFNYFFTSPLYTFQVHDPQYLFTFGIMLLIAVITSALTTRLGREAELSRLREKRTQNLYNFSRNLISTRNIEQTISTVTVSIASLSGSSVAFYTPDESGFSRPFLYSMNDTDANNLTSEETRKAVLDVFSSGQAKETDTVYLLPILGRKETLAAVGIDCSRRELTKDQLALLGSVSVQIALSIEREISLDRQQKSKVRIESERLRSNLLHSVSHDLKTPLAGIVGSSCTILDNWDNIDDTTKKTLLSGIYEEAQWLSGSVDNILSITRIEDGRIQVKKAQEAAEEVIGEAISRVQRYDDNKHEFHIEIPETLMLVPMDGSLIVQVLVNLIDNAVKYTPSGSSITVRACRKGKEAIFEVADSGSGISEKDLPFVFDRFFSTGRLDNYGRKGIGLGLAICKSIVLAHGGVIEAKNGENGGAVFTFSIPAEE